MKQLVSNIGDRFQALFPPNRIMLVAAPTVTAASLWLSAWLTAHVPGAELPAGVIAGAMGVVGLIAVTLFYKWFDQWQKGEPLTVDEDLNQAFEDADTLGTAFLSAHGTVQGVGASLKDLEERIAQGSINEAEIAHGVAGILDVIGQFAEEHPLGTEPPSAPMPVEETPPAPAAPAPSAE